MIGRSLRRVWRVVFGDISVRRDQGRLHVGFGETRVPGPAPAAAAGPAAPAGAPGAAPAHQEQRLRQALRGVLDADARSRRVFTALARVELMLHQGGVEAVKQMPAPILAEALSQLEGLVADWSVPGLGALQRLLQLQVLAADESAPTQPATDVHPSDFHAASRLQVSDASVSDFMKAAGTPPAG